MTGLEVTVHGDAYAIVPGATYVIEVDRRDLTAEQAQTIRDRFEERTGAKCFVFGGGMHIVPLHPDNSDEVAP